MCGRREAQIALWECMSSQAEEEDINSERDVLESRSQRLETANKVLGKPEEDEEWLEFMHGGRRMDRFSVSKADLACWMHTGTENAMAICRQRNRMAITSEEARTTRPVTTHTWSSTTSGQRASDRQRMDSAGAEAETAEKVEPSEFSHAEALRSCLKGSQSSEQPSVDGEDMDGKHRARVAAAQEGGSSDGWRA